MGYLLPRPTKRKNKKIGRQFLVVSYSTLDRKFLKNAEISCGCSPGIELFPLKSLKVISNHDHLHVAVGFQGSSIKILKIIIILVNCHVMSRKLLSSIYEGMSWWFW